LSPPLLKEGEEKERGADAPLRLPFMNDAY